VRSGSGELVDRLHCEGSDPANTQARYEQSSNTAAAVKEVLNMMHTVRNLRATGKKATVV